MNKVCHERGRYLSPLQKNCVITLSKALEQSDLHFQQFFNVTAKAHRVCGWSIPFYRPSIFIHQELCEIPFYTGGPKYTRQFLSIYCQTREYYWLDEKKYMSETGKYWRTYFRKSNRSSTFFPFTSTLSKIGNLTPSDFANFCISSSVPGSCFANWLQGNASIESPWSWYFSCNSVSPLYCVGVNVQQEATLTISKTLPWYLFKYTKPSLFPWVGDETANSWTEVRLAIVIESIYRRESFTSSFDIERDRDDVANERKEQ